MFCGSKTTYLKNNFIIQVLIVIVAGAITAVPFLISKLPSLSVFGLVMGIFVFCSVANLRRAALAGLAFGLAFFLVQTSWVLPLRVYAGWWAYLGWFILSLFEAFFIVIFATIAKVIHSRNSNWFWSALFLSVIFVVLEIIRSLSWWAYPWGLIGINFVDVKVISWLAAYTGWPGLSFIAVFISSAIALFLLEVVVLRKTSGSSLRGGQRPKWQSRPGYYSLALEGLVVTVLTLSILFLSSGFLPSTPNPYPSTKISLLQTDIDMQDKWQPQRQEANFYRLKMLAAKVPKDAEYIFTPESSLPGAYPSNEDLLKELKKNVKGKLFIGTLWEKETGTFNSVLAGSRYYDKNNLVLFGENVPFKFLFNYIDSFKENITPGRKINSLDKVAVLICSESADWLYAQKLAGKDSQFIAVLSNDAWFKGSSLAAEHLQSTRLRAIENGRYVVMASNGGYSAIINPQGEVVKQSSLGKDQVLSGYIQKITKSTFFSTFGFWVNILWIFLGLVVAGRMLLINESGHP